MEDQWKPEGRIPKSQAGVHHRGHHVGLVIAHRLIPASPWSACSSSHLMGRCSVTIPHRRACRQPLTRPTIPSDIRACPCGNRDRYANCQNGQKDINVADRIMNASAVFTEACASIASSTLPVVWLNNQVKNSDCRSSPANNEMRCNRRLHGMSADDAHPPVTGVRSSSCLPISG